MKSYRALMTISLVLMLVLGFAIQGCKESAPPAIWEEEDQGGTTPAITGVDPANAAWAGISPIVIHGRGFHSNSTVYFGNSIASIESLSSTRIGIIPPLDTGSAFTIKVINQDAYTFARFSPYALLSPKKDMAKLIDSSLFYAFDVDSNETIYIHQSSFLLRVPLNQGEAKIGAKSLAAKSTCIRLNRDGYIYESNAGLTRIFRMNLANGTEAEYVNTTTYARCFDFGKNGKTIYAGGNPSSAKNLTIIDSSKRVTKTSFFGTIQIQTIRFFASSTGDYVYVGAQSKTTDTSATPNADAGIWRCKVNTDGTLGTPTKVLDWSTGPVPTSVINDLTFAANGDMYIATNYRNPILIVHPNGTTGFLYPGALDSPVQNLVWGYGTSYLYLNYTKPGGKRVGRIVLDENLSPLNMKPVYGAPYYGRGK